MFSGYTIRGCSDVSWLLSGGHMEKQEMEIKRKLEMETETGN